MLLRLAMRSLFVVFTFTAATVLPADDLLRRVEEGSKRVMPSVVEWRRDLHAHPELSNREERTSRKVAELLRQFGVEDIKTGVARHGVVGLIRGAKPGPTVALRADMDALPVQEETGLPFASQNPGVMHACGHDAHMAILLGAAKVLSEMRDVIPGSVKLIFQPCEEGAPAGERGGAEVMIEEGVLRNPDVAAIFGLHVHPEMETGQIGWRLGPMMASVDRFRMTVTGKQAHASSPWLGVDAVVASAQIILALQTIVSRKIDAREPAVVSVSMVHGGRAWNILPETVQLEGTIRTHNAEVRREIEKQFRRIVQHTAAAQGAKAAITAFETGAPSVWNDPELGKRMKPAVDRVAGAKNVIEIKPAMAGEDFGCYALVVPGLFLRLGVHDKSAGPVTSLHTPTLRVDEAALPVGVRIMAMLALDFLSQAPAHR